MGDGSKLFDMIAPDAGAPFALLAAAEAGDEPRVASLLASEADVNARDERGWSPLIMAAKEGHASLLQLLLAAGALPNPPDVSHTALRGAAMFGHSGCIRLLAEARAEVDQRSAGGRTPLMGAELHGHAQALGLLLRVGAAADLTNDAGETAAALAESRGHGQALAVLRGEEAEPYTAQVAIVRAGRALVVPANSSGV